MSDCYYTQRGRGAGGVAASPPPPPHFWRRGHSPCPPTPLYAGNYIFLSSVMPQSSKMALWSISVNVHCVHVHVHVHCTLYIWCVYQYCFLKFIIDMQYKSNRNCIFVCVCLPTFLVPATPPHTCVHVQHSSREQSCLGCCCIMLLCCLVVYDYVQVVHV